MAVVDSTVCQRISAGMLCTSHFSRIRSSTLLIVCPKHRLEFHEKVFKPGTLKMFKADGLYNKHKFTYRKETKGYKATKSFTLIPEKC